ncbi:M3 family metallopeptidase [Gaoshiqia sediminis]|uniref:oligopeptidase A n=1 Tax=Gaoshiqia sediminis TaxID=2986998 RepID=A0AA42CA26_9BACT|nr:M3 family metallopeptidase [Gaoshiqia sediminis]MCW0482930.1 M3 family metallopeptidase [Gaoshiqia sediminis]
MKKITPTLVVLVATFVACNSTKETKTDMQNPFFAAYETPFQVPPFDQIKEEHYLPTVEEGIKQHEQEIAAITANTEAPTFENTILPFDESGDLLRRVDAVFGNLNSANTNEQMQALAREIYPKMTAHEDNVMLNKALFERVKAVYEQREGAGFDAEQMRVVEKYYQDFVRNGANLSDEDQAKLRELNQELSKLSLQFSENLLAETNKNFQLVVDNEADLKGLPEGVISAAADEAKKSGLDGKWVFTLQKPSLIPFLQYAENRDLREKIYRGYFMRGDNNNEFDNKEIISKMVELRDEKARLLGFENHAAYVIDVNMAKTPENVYDFLYKLWKPALDVAKKERAEMQSIIKNEGNNFELASWDWWYYAEKLRKQKYDLDEEETKPYFSLDNVREGIFYVSNQLYGIQFERRTDIPVYHPEVEAWEVKEADGSHVGVLYMDFHPRDGKRVGAWNTGFRDQAYKDGQKVQYPITSIVCNFTRPSGDLPALLTFDEVTTFFHEFGHALHGLFTDGPYQRTAGRVPRDFVELPSQIMENWAAEPEVLKVYAKHYKTGEVIPEALVQKIVNSGHFNQGFATVEYLAASVLDMDWHTQEFSGDVNAFEKTSMERIGLIDEIIPRYRSTYFSHIFSGGYSAGYYVYIWAAVLDTDAFHAFKESGDLFNAELAAKFRTLLAKSGSDEGMTIYRNFRGQDPSTEPLLEKRGLK